MHKARRVQAVLQVQLGLQVLQVQRVQQVLVQLVQLVLQVQLDRKV
jgi:hypothetical protein